MELGSFSFALENIATVLMGYVIFFFFAIYFASFPAMISFEKQYCVYLVTMMDELFSAVKQKTSIWVWPRNI